MSYNDDPNDPKYVPVNAEFPIRLTSLYAIFTKKKVDAAITREELVPAGEERGEKMYINANAL